MESWRIQAEKNVKLIVYVSKMKYTLKWKPSLPTISPMRKHNKPGFYNQCIMTMCIKIKEPKVKKQTCRP